MRLLTVLLLVFTTGCVTLKPQNLAEVTGTAEDYAKIPMVDLFNEIVNEPYLIHVYDCSNKCAKYVRALKEAGYDAEILAIKPYNSPLGMLHAVVRIKVNDNYLYVDPTNNEWTRNVRAFGTFLYVIEWDGVEDNYDAFGDRLHEVEVHKEYNK